VLPFENLGGPNEEPFAAGITDEITSRLVEISALRVVSRTSAKRFKGRAVSIADVGKALNADYILEGTVRTDRAANGAGTARVTPQLIRVSDDVHVWQHRFDASLTPGDIFGVQAAIATQVAAAMNVTILEPEKRRVARAVTNDSAAYRLYQLGRFQWEKRTPESLARAQEYFREAIKRDPNFARAYAGLGDASFIYARTVTPDSGRVKSAAAISALRRAVALDSTLAEGYAGLGYALAIGTWDRAAADSAFRRAIALDPNYAPAHYWYAQLLWLTGAPSTTLEEAREAVNLDPLSAVAHVVLGLTYRRAARYGEALAEFQRSFELQPTYVLPQLWLCLEYGRLGQAKAAEDAARQFVSGLPHERIDEEAVREFARVAAGRGDAIKLVRLLDAGGVDLGHSTIAILFAQARMPDSAFARMQRAIDVGNAVVVQGLAYLEPLLGHDPRWPALVRRAGFVSR
jgi:TolB-like protein/cytochrome c-type biogenesis protein CcmH/NrfG